MNITQYVPGNIVLYAESPDLGTGIVTEVAPNETYSVGVLWGDGEQDQYHPDQLTLTV